MISTRRSFTRLILFAAVLLSAQTGRAVSIPAFHDHDIWCGPEREPDSLQDRPARPILSGPVLTRTRTHFKVHYTTQGRDSTTLAYAESTIVHAETSWVRLGRLGWYRPPSDQTAGGDSLYDIYIWDSISGSGVCQTDSAYTTPFPDGASTWIEILPNRDYDRLRTLVAHEFHHGCQKRYTRYDRPPKWFNENSSVYMEDIVYPGLGNLYDYTRTYATSPVTNTWRPLVDTVDRYEYAAGLWPKFLVEYYGPTIVREIWELNGMHAGNHTLSDMDSLLQRDYFSSLPDACGHYAIWRYFTGSRDDEMHFLEAESIGTANLLAVHTTYPVSGNSGVNGIYGPGGTHFIRFQSLGNRRLTVTFNGQDLYSWRVYVLMRYDGITYEQRMLLDWSGDGSIDVAPGYADSVVLIPVEVGWMGDTAATVQVSFTYSADVVVDNAVVEAGGSVKPSLSAAGSNPAIDAAYLRWMLPVGTLGTLNIFDLTGRLIRSRKFAGTGGMQVWRWDLTDEYGRRIPSGVYYYSSSGFAPGNSGKIVVP